MNELLERLFAAPSRLGGVALHEGRAASSEAVGMLGDDAVMLVVEAPFGQVQRVSVQANLLDQRDEAQAYFDALAQRIPGHFQASAQPGTARRKRFTCEGAVVLLSHFRERTPDAEEFDAVQLDLISEKPVTATARTAGFDVAGVVSALATRAFPPAKLEPVVLALASRPGWEPAPDWERALEAAHRQHAARLPEVVEAVLRAVSWKDLRGPANEPASLILRGLLPRVPSGRTQRLPLPGWFPLPQEDLFGVVSLCSAPEAQRGELAVSTFRALVLGDVASRTSLRARVELPLLLHLTFDATDELEVRLFDLLQAGLEDDLARLLLPLRTSTPHAARAATNWLAVHRGLRVEPTDSRPRLPEWKLASDAWSTFFRAVQQHFPQHLDAVAARFGQCSALLKPDVVEAVCGAAGAALSKTTFQLGLTRFTVRGSTVAVAAATAPPKPVKATAPKKAPSKTAAKAPARKKA